MSLCCFDLLPSVSHCHLQLFAVQFDVPVINKIKIGNSYLFRVGVPLKAITAKFVVSRCAFCKLRGDFGFFSSVNHSKEGGGGGGVNANRKNALARLGTQKQN